MRIKLKQGKQKELILLAKGDKSWKGFSKLVNFPENYLSHDIKNERVLISEDLYNKICTLTNKNFDRFIITKLDDGWGRSKGGLNSKGSTIKITRPLFDERLAEFVGAVLGDGHVGSYKKGNKGGVYHIRMAGDLQKDKDYHLNYLKPLCKNIFQLDAKEMFNDHERFLNIVSKELVNFFASMGINPGDKIRNQSTIPKWIWENKFFLGVCLRGLIDTDGSIFRMSNKDPTLLRLGFTNHNITLLTDARKAFIQLGFSPSKIVNSRQFYISRQSEIKKYLKEIGFSNRKHLDRLKTFKSPVV